MQFLETVTLVLVSVPGDSSSVTIVLQRPILGLFRWSSAAPTLMRLLASTSPEVEVVGSLKQATRLDPGEPGLRS